MLFSSAPLLPRIGNALLLALLALSAWPAAAETLGEFLPVGPHAVGFRTLAARDASRSSYLERALAIVRMTFDHDVI